MVQSFYDAPGNVVVDDDNVPVADADGNYEVVKGTRFKEELSEINIAFGMEWWYNDVFAVRTGFFYESPNKGNRQYLNLGASLKYNMFSIDFSYLAALGNRQSPLANTLRFTVRLDLDQAGANSNP